MVDIKSEDKEVGLDVLQYIHHHKTAALLEAAVVCGAIVGGADEKTVEKLRKYALNIGLAFQVHIRGGTWREFSLTLVVSPGSTSSNQLFYYSAHALISHLCPFGLCFCRSLTTSLM